MKKKISIKKHIEKKIELSNNKLALIRSKPNGMNKGDVLRIYGNNNKPANVDLFKSRHEMRTHVDTKPNSTYVKKVYVDYDVVICIPSHNRYEKVKRLIGQFNEQPTKYTFKIILLDDGSDDIRYSNLISDFPEIIYMKNEIPNGLENHWYCYNQLWNRLKSIECYSLLQMDDDFILCDNFLDIIMDLYFKVKSENNLIGVIAPHTWSFNVEDKNVSFPKGAIDGIGLFDIEFIKMLEYKLDKVKFYGIISEGNSARAWSQIIDRLKENNIQIYRTDKSLVWHDGNDDSKLHGEFRRVKAIYTQNFINNRSYD